MEKNLTKTHKFHSENFQYSLQHFPGEKLNEPPEDSIEAESIKIKASFGQKDHEHIDGQDSDNGPEADNNNEVTTQTSTTPTTTTQPSLTTEFVVTTEELTTTTTKPTEVPVVFTTREMTTENGSGDSTTEDQTTILFIDTLITTLPPTVEISTTESDQQEFMTFTTGHKYGFQLVFDNASEYSSFEFSVRADADFYIAFRTVFIETTPTQYQYHVLLPTVYHVVQTKTFESSTNCKESNPSDPIECAPMNEFVFWLGQRHEQDIGKVTSSLIKKHNNDEHPESGRKKIEIF